MSLRYVNALIASLSFFACTSLFASPLTVDITGVQSTGEIGDPGNTVLTFNVGANAHVTSIDYLVNLTAFDPSWLSEIGMAFTSSDEVTGVIFNPGFGATFPGTDDYSGSANLIDFALDFNVGSDGILRIEFYEDFDDFPGADGLWNSGTVTFGFEPAAVPEPASILLLGAGAVVLGYSRRRRAAPSARVAAVHTVH